MFRTLFSIILLFGSLSANSAIIEIRRGGGDSLVAEATNAIANFNGVGTNTTLVGNPVVTGDIDFRSEVHVSTFTTTNTATFLGTGVAVSDWVFQSFVTIGGLLTMTDDIDATGQSITAETLNTTTINATTLNAPQAFTNANTLFVHKGGNDTTGIRGGLGKYAFLSLTGAQAKAISGDIVIVYPGTYTTGGLGKDGVDWNFQSGVILNAGVNLYMFNSTNFGSAAFNIYGSAEVTNGFIIATNGNIYAEVRDIRGPDNVIKLAGTNANVGIKVKRQLMGKVDVDNSQLDLEAFEYFLASVDINQSASAKNLYCAVRGNRFIRSVFRHDGDSANCKHKTDFIVDYVKGPNTGDWTTTYNDFALGLIDGIAHVRDGYFVSGTSGKLMLFDASSSTLHNLTLIQTNGVSNIINNSSSTPLNIHGTLIGNTELESGFSLNSSAGMFIRNTNITVIWEL